MANWAARYRQAHPEALVIEHYIGATPYSSHWAPLLWRILGEFKQRLGLTQEIPEQPDALRNAFPNWLYMASQRVAPSDAGLSGWWRKLLGKAPRKEECRYKRIVLVLDALNQLEDRDGAPDLLWLPPVMPENVRLVVSTLPGRPLDEIRRRAWPVLNVEPLGVDERKELIRHFLLDYGRTLAPARVERVAAASQSANPLYLRVLLDELRLFGQHERLEERIGYYLQAGSPHELYGKVISRWTESFGADLVRDTLSLLWAARRGLTESELLQLLGPHSALRDPHSALPQLPRATWSPLFLALALADALISRGGLLSFAHDFLRAAAREAYLPTEPHQQQAHTRLADYFAREPTGPRRTDEPPWQLAEARAWYRLSDLLADRLFLAAAWAASEFDVETYWAQIEAGSPLRMVEVYRAQLQHPESEADKGHLCRLSILLADTGHPEEALRLRAALVEHFKAADDMSRLSASLGNLAVTLQSRGELDGAMALHKEEERICRQLDNLDGLSSCLGNQALILRDRGDLDGAMALHEEEEKICRQSRNLDGLSKSLGNQALILKERGDLDGAMALLKEAERICRQLGNLDGLPAKLGNQALILKARGDLDGAMALHEEEERICRQLRNLDGLSKSLGNQAVILHARGDLDGAMALHKEEERICRQLDNLDGLSSCLNNQALILQDRGDLDGAMALHKEEERLCRQLGNVEELARSLASQAFALQQMGRAREGLALANEAHRLATSHGYTALASGIEFIQNSLRQAAQRQ